MTLTTIDPTAVQADLTPTTDCDDAGHYDMINTAGCCDTCGEFAR